MALIPVKLRSICAMIITLLGTLKLPSLAGSSRTRLVYWCLYDDCEDYFVTKASVMEHRRKKHTPEGNGGGEPSHPERCVQPFLLPSTSGSRPVTTRKLHVSDSENDTSSALVPKRSRGFSFKVTFVKNPERIVVGCSEFKMPMPVAANFLTFTNEDLFRFINEYKKHRMLYDFDHPLYTNNVERIKRFSAISRRLKIDWLTAEGVRAKIRVLRKNYSSRLRECYRKQRTGEHFSAPYWWHMVDKFLRSHMRFRDPDIVDGYSSSNPKDWMDNPETIQYQEVSALQSINKNAAATEAEVYFDSDIPVSSTVEVIEEQVNDDEEQEVSVKQMNVNTEIVEDSRLPENSTFLELDDEEAIEKGEMSIEDVTARAEAATSQHHRESVTIVDEDDEVRSRTAEESEIEDKYDAFGDCVALQLRTLPIDAALELEGEIHSLITKKRIALLRKNKLHLV